MFHIDLCFTLTCAFSPVSCCQVCFFFFHSPTFLQDPAAEVRMKVASITEQVLTLVNKRLGLYRHMDEVVNRYKQSRDTGALNSGRKTLEAEHRTLTNDISTLQARLKAEGSDLAEKVSVVGVKLCDLVIF